MTTSTTCSPPTRVRRRLRRGWLRRHRPCRRRHRHLHGLADRPAADARPPARRREDLPQPRRPGHPAGARGPGARRAPAQRRPDPGHPAHPLRDDRLHRSRSCASASASPPARTSAGSSSTSSTTSSPPSTRTSRKVRSHPLIPDTVKVGGFLYDVDTGLHRPQGLATGARDARSGQRSPGIGSRYRSAAPLAVPRFVVVKR